MREIHVPTTRGVLLDGVLFDAPGETRANTLVVAITGIHGNFYSNPFYYVVADTLNAVGIDFAYAQTCDAFGQMPTANVIADKREVIGSWNERFSYACEDVRAYVDFAEREGYEHVILAGHSLGANKVIRYLSEFHDERVEHFILLSPCNVPHLTASVSARERAVVQGMVAAGRGGQMLPFELMGWVPCIASTAWDRLFSDELDNVHVEDDGDFTQVGAITHIGALLIGTYDTFTYGDPAGFLETINRHMPRAAENKLVFIERTGHTYQQKEQELADDIRDLVEGWR